MSECIEQEFRAIWQRLQDPSQLNGYNLNNVRRKTR